MKKFRLWLCMTALACGLSGCGNKEATYDTTTVIVDEEGTIKEVAVEPFDKAYYDAAELESYTKSEVDSYNYKKISTQILLDSVEVEGDTAKVVISYKTDEDYREFNEEELFVGTIREAMDEGYAFDKTFRVYGKDENVSVAEVTAFSTYGIVITTQSTDVVVPNKIAYISSGVTTQSKKHATATDDVCYIIYKQ